MFFSTIYRSSPFVLFTCAFLFFFFMGKNEFVYQTFYKICFFNYSTDGKKRKVAEPYQDVTNKNIIRWDAYHYNNIQKYGYNEIKETKGDHIYAFFPLFPSIWKWSYLPNKYIPVLNFLMFFLSLLVLFKALDITFNYRNASIIFVIPNLICFIIPYSEATSALMLSIAFYGLVKNKYGFYFIGAFLASLSRSSFSVLLVALVAVEVYKLTQSSEKWRLYLLNAFKRIFPIIVGSMALGFIQVSQGADSYFKYIEVLKYWENELSIPHNISDWSHEGFGMSVGFLISISLPLMAWVMHAIISGLKNLMNTQQKKTILITSEKDEVFYISVLYIIGDDNRFVLDNKNCQYLHYLQPYFY